ncbi:hypothetical protein ES703_95419 [subsurface metagenome]
MIYIAIGLKIIHRPHGAPGDCGKYPPFVCFGKALPFLVEQRMDAFQEFHFIVSDEILLIHRDKGVTAIEEFTKRPSISQSARLCGMRIKVARFGVIEAVLHEGRHRFGCFVRHKDKHQHFCLALVVAETNLHVFARGFTAHKLRISSFYLELHFDRALGFRDAAINEVAEQRKDLRAPNVPPFFGRFDRLTSGGNQKGRKVIMRHFALVINDITVILFRLPRQCYSAAEQ